MPSSLSSPVSVPLCHLNGSLVQVFDPATCRRSAFQVDFLSKVAARPDFAYFVTVEGPAGPRLVDPGFRCPFLIMWYTTDGQCHAAYIGVRRMIRDEWLVGKPGTPEPANHVVYRSRMPGFDEILPPVSEARHVGSVSVEVRRSGKAG